MRGFLRIHSQRSPYLRAGLSWPAREPIEPALADLDGARFKELLVDPLLTIMVGTEPDGTFVPVPEGMAALSIAELQLLIDAVPRDAGPEQPLVTAEAKLALIGEHLDDIGLPSIDALFQLRTDLLDDVGRLTGQLTATQNELITANGALEDARNEIAELKAKFTPATQDNDGPAREPASSADAGEGNGAAERNAAPAAAKKTHAKPKADTARG